MAEQPNTLTGGGSSRGVGRGDFPKFSLEEGLGAPNALLRNDGQPLTAIDMATALGRSPGSSTFRMQTAAASAYALTGGSYKTQFTMAEGGRAIVEPTSPDEKARGLVAAALTPPAFRKAYDYYKGKKFPEEQFFINTAVREFGIQQSQAAKFVEIFTANMRFVGLIKETPGGDWLARDAVPQPTATSVTEPEVEELEAGLEEHDAEDEDVVPPPPQAPAQPDVRGARQEQEAAPAVDQDARQPRHPIPRRRGRAQRRPADLAEGARHDEPVRCRDPIFTADQEYFDKDGNPIWKPSENVSHELGAAAVMYDDRVILFKEESVDLASNYSGIGYIPFEKDQLDAKVNDLLRELMGLKILRMSLGDDE